MSTPDQPDTPQLTRRQLREMRNTASTPVITPADAEKASQPAEPTPPVVAPLPRAAEPVEVAEAPPAAADVDVEAPSFTRRAARRQERLRTASVPVADETPGPAATSSETGSEARPEDVAPADATAENAPEIAQDEERPVVAPTFGSGLLAGESVEIDLPASFDQLLTRGSTATGALSAPNALILSQTPETGALVSPITGTGEVLITGTFSLPESFGSTGTMPGRTDNKETDAVLVDGELPASSSPTPIAASSAISTIKSAEDIIKPPAPEKGSRLMLALVITAGALALALTGVLIVALVTGAFR
ncbi:hypothetical protein E5344_07280 [Microbacterium laevaniformans]|uniref:Uncharacterized protein n=1 Tax=Microbacterium laevaniformans TaxID=36807 RepID=A0A4S2D8W5_9MICO|nr:hypothetical protein [Microbacterium laevaniformans]TGY38177.1 hypothetical protein E5344_07280 [Microbacterium laevaniformans]